jgi:hypothetical protein
MKRKMIFVVLFSFFATASFAQLREIPQAVKDAFMAQYSGAASPEYVDKVMTVQVHFEQDSSKMTATYNNKGMWRETEQEWSYDKLSDEVKDGFEKSKYSGDEWEVKETKIITRPGNKMYYRVKVQKNEVQKKYLFFSATGKLESESITI